MPAFRSRLLASASLAIGALSAALVPIAASANPQDGQVVAGQAVISAPSPSTVQVEQQTQKAIIDWRSFSIGADEQTRFVQPNADAIALNRVTSGDPSAILGALSANGQVWLINPNGIAFSETARVDVAGLLATTLDIANGDFLSGNYRFRDAGAGPASVTNAGRITVRDAGLAGLVAPSVANSGIIEARLGHIQLASASGFTLDLYGDGTLSFLLDAQVSGALASAGLALSNTGSLVADGGSVFLTADAAKGVVDQAINMSGYVQARTVGEREGVVTLDGGPNGSVAIAGSIDASGTASGETGGTVAITGEHVALTSGADIDATGDAGGGTVLVGGDYQGTGTLRTASLTTVAEGSVIRADALNAGDGGRVIVWSDDTTTFLGSISATGGLKGGDGGFVEVSGHRLLDFDGSVDLRASAGEAGTLLLDPRDLIIQAAGTTNAGSATSGSQTTYTATGDSSVLTVAALQAALALGNVIVQTGADGSQAGDITVASNVGWSTGSKLTLSAHRNIIVNSGVTISNVGTGSLVLYADNTGTGTGTVTFNGTGRVGFGSSTGTVEIYYNPQGGYASPTNFRSSVQTRHGDADGLLTSYMLVNNISDLQSIAQNLIGVYALGRDIDASSAATLNAGSGFAPIGNASTPFFGILDGLGRTIDNLTIVSSNRYVGLFGYVGRATINGTHWTSIRNLHLTDISVAGTNLIVGSDVGGLAGYNEAEISNVSVSGGVASVQSYASSATPCDFCGVGGVVGKNIDTGGYRSGFISGTTSHVSVSATGGVSLAVGGLVGTNDGGTISNSHATGSVTGDRNNYAGGLVGSNIRFESAALQPEISQSSASGSVSTGVSAFIAGAGGLVGQNSGTISESFASGSVSGGNNAPVGGLVGVNGYGTVTDSYATGSVHSASSSGGPSGGSGAGGLVGRQFGTLDAWLPGRINASYSTGAVTGGEGVPVGGLVGSLESGTINNSFWDTQASGLSTLAGAVDTGVSTASNGRTTSEIKAGLSPGFSPTIWKIDPEINDGYPSLVWQIASPSPELDPDPIPEPPPVDPPPGEPGSPVPPVVPSPDLTLPNQAQDQSERVGTTDVPVQPGMRPDPGTRPLTMPDGKPADFSRWTGVPGPVSPRDLLQQSAIYLAAAEAAYTMSPINLASPEPVSWEWFARNIMKLNDQEISFYKFMGFQAAIYNVTVNGQRRTVVSFAGSQPTLSGAIPDFLWTDLPNAFGVTDSLTQYRFAAIFSSAAQAYYGNVTLTGHSLGGGLAAYAGATSNIPAVTFDPAYINLNSSYGAENVLNFSLAGNLSDAQLIGGVIGTNVYFSPDVAQLSPSSFVSLHDLGVFRQIMKDGNIQFATSESTPGGTSIIVGRLY